MFTALKIHERCPLTVHDVAKRPYDQISSKINKRLCTIYMQTRRASLNFESIVFFMRYIPDHEKNVMDRIQVVSKRTGAQNSSLTSHQINNLAPKIQDQKY